MARVYPAGEPPRMDRHGRWRGLTGDRVVWEVQYTRGNPTGPYREWNEAGELMATWPYNWEGEIDGWVRWFEGGEPVAKVEVDPKTPIRIQSIGNAAGLRQLLTEENGL